MRFPRLPSRGTRSQGRVRQACPGGPSHPPKDPLLPTCTPQQITMTVAGCGRLRRPSTQPALRTRRWRKPGGQVTKREGFQRKCWGPVQQPPNVTRTRGAFPVAPPQEGDRGLRFGALEAVVGVHFRIDGWGFERGSCPTSSPPCGAPGHGSVCAVPLREAVWGRRRRGRAPAPKSWGPLLPSRTPTPRNTAGAASGGLCARPSRARMASR